MPNGWWSFQAETFEERDTAVFGMRLSRSTELFSIGTMRLDRTAFKRQSFSDAADHQRHYKQMSPREQAESFRYLMSVAYGFVGRDWPRMDKTAYQTRRHP